MRSRDHLYLSPTLPSVVAKSRETGTQAEVREREGRLEAAVRRHQELLRVIHSQVRAAAFPGRATLCPCSWCFGPYDQIRNALSVIKFALSVN